MALILMKVYNTTLSKFAPSMGKNMYLSFSLYIYILCIYRLKKNSSLSSVRS